MGRKIEAIIYVSEKGECYLDPFYNSLTIEEKQKVDAIVDQLEIEGEKLPRPYADTLRDGVHELRIKLSGNQIRILYFFIFRNYAVLTHSFIKTMNEVPEEEIDFTIKCREDFLKRFPTVEKLKDYFS